LRFATDALMLAIAGVVETLSAPAAEIGNEPSWRIVFALLVLTLLALRGHYRAAIGQHFLDDARAILTGTALAAMLITFLRVAFADHPNVPRRQSAPGSSPPPHGGGPRGAGDGE
jgi:hypothetical protein